jgi:predicted nicotinamide N-methyase
MSLLETSTRSFDVPSGTGTTFSIKIHEDISIRADNLNLETWGASLILARHLHSIQIPNLSSAKSNNSCGPVIEIGAGTGLVGISAAAIWKTNVTLTDLAPIAPALASNIALNKDLLSSTGGSGSSGALDWNIPSVVSFPQGPELQAEDNKAHVILAADTIYDSSHPEMLATVIKTWLKPGPDSRVIIAYPVRVAYLEEIRELWERMEMIGFELVEEGKEELPKKDWDDEVLIEWCVWKWKE